MTPPRQSREAATRDVLTLREQVLESLAPERVALDRIGGRVLASSVTADRDVPARTRATMDGFAVAAGDGPSHDLREERVGPGDDPPEHRPGAATRIATGASLPAGADAVVPVEDAEVEDGQLVAAASDADLDVPAGQHVVARGSVVTAGETVLAAGRRLAPRDAAVLADLGRDGVSVRRRLSAALLATGTEIHEGREPDRDSPFLANLVRAWGGDPTLAGSVPDDPDRVGDRLVDLAGAHDVVVTTGGTGVASTDETGGALQDLDVRVDGVAMRPGSKTTVAWVDDESTVVVSLPGVPGAAFAGALFLVRPLFVGASRLPSVAARLATDLPMPDRDGEFVVPVQFRGGDVPDAAAGDAADGSVPSVVPFGHAASSVNLFDRRFRPHRVASCVRLSAADGVVLARDDLAAGDRVAVVPYEAVES